MEYHEAYVILKEYNQEHVLHFYDQLSPDERQNLLKQVEQCNHDLFRLIQKPGSLSQNDVVEPIDVLTINDIQKRKDELEVQGLKAIRSGKVAAVLLAGGQGSRLGADKPKGIIDIGITRPLYIFECLFNNILDVVKKAGHWIPLYIMTNEINHGAITEFLSKKSYFGYDKRHIKFFTQEMFPAIDFQGKYLMSSKSSLAMSPNGNGGWFLSMQRAGLIQEFHAQGIEWLNAFAVDNVLQRIVDPVFVGATIESGCLSGAKVVEKVTPYENLGVICKRNGRPSVVEYYELSEDMAEARTGCGKLAYNYGVILNYLFNVSNLEVIAATKCPLHLAKKKIETIDDLGNPVFPTSENGYKIETLILDMVEMSGHCLPFEVLRNREFAPIKNKTGVDSIESARQLLIENGISL